MTTRARWTLCALLLTTTATTVGAETRAGNDVDIKTADGTLIKGSYVSAGKPGPGVILLHMCNSQRKAWAGLAPMLAAKGIHVLAIDYRGYGDSGGARHEKWTMEERNRTTREVWPGDIDRAFDFLVAQPGVDKQRIGAAGGSCGVNNSIQLSRRHPEVKTLVLLAGGTTAEGQQHLERSPWIPILAAAARDDGDAVETTGWIMGFSSNPLNQLKVYDNGGHGTEIFSVHKDLEPMIAAWFERHLVTQPVKATPGVAAKPGPSSELAAKLRVPGAIAGLTAEVRASKKGGAKLALPPQGVINALGYEHVAAGRTKEAIEVLTLNVEAHPDSANAYDSLSDAYLAAKDRAKAARANK